MGKVGNQGKDLAQGYVGFTLICLVSRVLLLCYNISTYGIQLMTLCNSFIITIYDKLLHVKSLFQKRLVSNKNISTHYHSKISYFLNFSQKLKNVKFS